MKRTGSSGQYTFSVANKSGARADYTVQASSVVNPLAPSVIQGFQCPGQL